MIILMMDLQHLRRDKVFGKGTFSLFSSEYFKPLHAGEENIRKSQHIILSIGGNDFREFLMQAAHLKGQQRSNYIKNHLDTILEDMRDRYIEILRRVRILNADAKIILMTQYYPSVSQNNYGIYPFMKEIGETLNRGGIFHNPMTVIHDIMQLTYADVLKRIPHDDNIVVADITSSLNPYDNNNHTCQIEPSGLGGKKIAQILEYMISSPHITSGQAYRFYPDFFTSTEKNSHVEGSNFNNWVPAHPYDLRDGYTYAEEKIFRTYNADQLDCDTLLRQLDQEIKNSDDTNSMHQAAINVYQKAESLAYVMPESDKKKWKMSVVLAINVLSTAKMKEHPEKHQKAIRLLMANANDRAIGKANGWKQFKGALTMLAGAAIITLSIAGIPFTGGASLIGFYVAGGLLSTAGAAFFYRNRQKSLSKESSILAREARRLSPS